MHLGSDLSMGCCGSFAENPSHGLGESDASQGFGNAHAAMVIVESDEGIIFQENSVKYLESKVSFESMDFSTPTASTKTSPTAASHRQHVARLDAFLRRVMTYEAVLQQEVKRRRCSKRSSD